jgi:hypothetical protein
MPCISQFYGISIYVYHQDHAPPHIHAVHAEYIAAFEIATGHRLTGDFPPRAERLVRDWLELRRAEVMASWSLSHGGDPPFRVAPLD